MWLCTVSHEEAKKINGFWDHDPQKDILSTLIFVSTGFLIFLRSYSSLKKISYLNCSSPSTIQTAVHIDINRR